MPITGRYLKIEYVVLSLTNGTYHYAALQFRSWHWWRTADELAKPRTLHQGLCSVPEC